MFGRRRVVVRSLPIAAASLLLGCAVGAGVMALFDPTAGPQRRGALRRRARALRARTPSDAQPTAAARNNPDATNSTARHAAESRDDGRSSRDGAHRMADGVDEATLVARRVRAALAHLCEDASLIEVRVLDGVVELHGPVPRAQQRRVVRGVRKVAGVGELHSYLQPYDRHGPVHADGRDHAVLH